MDFDFTYKNTEKNQSGQYGTISDESFSLYKNFCLLNHDGSYDKIESEYNVFSGKIDCIHKVNKFVANIKEAIKWSKEQPCGNCIKILDFILKKCDEAIELYSKEFNVVQNYEPDQSEIEKYMGNPYVEDFNDSLYEELMEDGYDKAIEAYEKTHKQELEGLSTLNKVAYNVKEEIYIQTVKQKFIKEALAYQGEKEFTPDLLKFIIAPDKEHVKSILKQILADKKGKQIALYIIALEKAKYIYVPTRSSFYEAIRLSFGYDIGSDQSINRYLTKSIERFQSKQEYAFFSNIEIEKAIESLAI